MREGVIPACNTKTHRTSVSFFSSIPSHYLYWLLKDGIPILKEDFIIPVSAGISCVQRFPFQGL